ncbi:motility associated factor glycosyltransferase family protein [Spirosoma gilvum]
MIEAVFNSVSQFINEFFASLVSLLKVAMRLQHATRLPARQRPACSVLGNGPSLNESLTEQFEFIKQTEIVCVNNFAHADIFTRLQPQDYVISDPNYFVFTEHTTDRDDIRQTLAVFRERVDWPMTLYVPHFAKGSYLLRIIQEGNPNISVVYFNYTVVRGFRWLVYWLYAKGFGMPQAQTVIIAALALMINRKFERIYLFGADTSWHEQIRLNDQNQLLIKQIHFYDKPKDISHQPVYSDAQRQRTFSMASQFLAFHKVFRGYEVLRDYADYRGVNIINASAKSYIDAFEREKLPQPVSNP